MQTAIITVILLVISNVFMTLAWYGHLRLQQTGMSSNWPLYAVILFSWGIAANRMGFQGNGGPFSLVQLKVLQEAITLVVFTVVAMVMFQGVTLRWNHIAAFVLLIAAVYLVFMD